MSKTGCCAGCGQSGCAQNGCGACCGGGCGLSPKLSAGEKKLLERFAELPFLPLVRERESGEVTLLESGMSPMVARSLLSLLERRALVRVDAELPIGNFDYSAYGEAYTHGSAALTARGQETLDDLEFEG